MCQACYTRLRRNGTLERQYVVNSGVCSENGCGKPAFSKNLCKNHYSRSQHPLKTPWKLLRSRNTGQFPPSWGRFETFLADVGERPTPQHQLRRIDPSLPYSKDNVTWLAPISVPDHYAPGQRAIYEREWRFQRRFGITVADYDRMLTEQHSVCAVCKRPPTQVHAKSGKVRDLAVDHDHATGAVRGLLCTDCNTTLGLVDDSVERLQALAAYLRRHQPLMVPGMTLLATLPAGLGAVTGLTVRDGALVASSESGIDFIVPANKMPGAA
jgi:hypothetical protein